MTDSFATVYGNLRTMEAAMERAMNKEPLFDEDVPPITQSHANISIAIDAMGPFGNPFAAAAAAEANAAPAIDDAKETDAKLSLISFTEIKYGKRRELEREEQTIPDILPAYFTY
jgi:hypothetical protein